MMSSILGGISRLNRIAGDWRSQFNMALKISAVVSPSKGNAPVAISYRTAPNENRSVRASSSLASHLLRRHVGDSSQRRAGAGQLLFAVVTVCVFAEPIWLEDVTVDAVTFANPKSRIFACPRFVTKMFAGLMSRWMMPSV